MKQKDVLFFRHSELEILTFKLPCLWETLCSSPVKQR